MTTRSRKPAPKVSPSTPSDDMDAVWKALADATRRSILDALREGPKTTAEIVERFPHLSRFGVMKHLQVLRDCDLVLVREEGRTCVNSLNAVPIRQIHDRWIGKFAEQWAKTLTGLKKSLEEGAG